MPKDKRLYMTFPIDFHRHPKVDRLPVDVRWTFVEMNGEARLADNDGVFDAAEAEFLWPVEHLDALVSSHPSKPLLVRDGDTYVIREYAAHQHTKADREALTQKRVEAGKIGAANRWHSDSKPIASAKQADSKGIASAKQMVGKSWQPIAESESELENTQLNLKSYVNSQHPSNFMTNDEVGQLRVRKRSYASLGIKNPVKIQSALVNALTRDVNEFETFRIVIDIMSKATGMVKSPEAYVLTAIKNGWAELQRDFDAGMYGGEAS